MTKGFGIGTEMFGESEGLVKPGMTKARLAEIEATKGQPLEGDDPFGDVFAEATRGRIAAARPRSPPRRERSPVPEAHSRPGESGIVAKEENNSEALFVRLEEVAFDDDDGPVIPVDVPFAHAQNPAESFSVDFWARPSKGLPSGSGYRCPLSSRDMPPPRGYVFFITPQGRWAFWIGIPEAQAWLKVEGTQARADEWQRLTGTYSHEEKAASLFVDGELHGRLSVSTLQPPMLRTAYEPNSQRSLRIGAGGVEGATKFPFRGGVRGVRVYGFALATPPPLEEEAEPPAKRQR